MTLTIDLPPKLEARLRERAAKLGVDAAKYLVTALETYFDRSDEAATPDSQVSAMSHLSPAKSRLLVDINAGLPIEIWDRYHQLLGKRQADALTPEEHRELTELSDRIEEANSRRLELALEYSNAVGRSLDEVVKELGIAELAHV